MNQSGAKHNQNNAGRKGDGPSTAAVSAGQPAVASVDGNGHIPMLEPCPLCATGPRAEPRPRRHPTRWVVPATVLVLTAALFVVSDMLERHIFPDMSTGLRHALLTLRAAIVTGAGTIFMYWWMRRQEQRLSETAEEITGLLEAYRRNPSTRLRFENPHLVHCCKLVDCRRTDCPVNGNLDRRCWQVLGLNSNYDLPLSSVDIERCHECAVYLRSCPDKLYELGESFNNLMYLLEQESHQLGRMRAQMVEKEKMVAVGQMAAGIAHEVCNPLSSISSVVQVIKRSGFNGRMRDQLNLIETHIQRITQTVRQLVSLARPGVERWDLADICEILQDTVDLLSFDRRARNVRVVLEPAKSIPKTHAVRGQLQQVFINLMLNALDAMPDGGRLRIGVRRRRDHIVIRLEDSGCGIPADLGRRIFEPFFTTKEPGKGTGMGLSVSYGIIQKHNGTIDFESAPDKGTAFTVQLPILDKAPDH